jgi:hypothetical protein
MLILISWLDRRHCPKLHYSTIDNGKATWVIFTAKGGVVGYHAYIGISRNKYLDNQRYVFYTDDIYYKVDSCGILNIYAPHWAIEEAGNKDTTVKIHALDYDSFKRISGEYSSLGLKRLSADSRNPHSISIDNGTTTTWYVNALEPGLFEGYTYIAISRNKYPNMQDNQYVFYTHEIYYKIDSCGILNIYAPHYSAIEEAENNDTTVKIHALKDYDSFKRIREEYSSLGLRRLRADNGSDIRYSLTIDNGTTTTWYVYQSSGGLLGSGANIAISRNNYWRMHDSQRITFYTYTDEIYYKIDTCGTLNIYAGGSINRDKMNKDTTIRIYDIGDKWREYKKGYSSLGLKRLSIRGLWFLSILESSEY